MESVPELRYYGIGGWTITGKKYHAQRREMYDNNGNRTSIPCNLLLANVATTARKKATSIDRNINECNFVPLVCSRRCDVVPTLFFIALCRRRELFVLSSALARNNTNESMSFPSDIVSFPFLFRCPCHSLALKFIHEFPDESIFIWQTSIQFRWIFSPVFSSLSIFHFASGETHSLLHAVFEFLVDAPMNFRFIWEPRMSEQKQKKKKKK